ncbi:MAG: glycosyltransferase family 2 protein [Alphaproteobacteria bacterium]|jgi:glycosyltransferase involved in cell wall biosynthesis|nr:glycosyltransferase family 2 protein [Alphaproteobacteria bacterium]MCB1551959.1 glycosyltransferase family 2 protein [Alphaproteobacteria bacterium]MCB9984692.1 glycosyltransferase family 2 protein [Micavibrio sp.]HRK98359.1 glycosyltransferase family 2 protein [Alphaproteobacteria bacterium]
MSIKITIGITCYNAEATIVQAIESACMQDYADFEIVVVDDCSQDNSVSLVKEAIKDKTNILLVCHKENKGYPSALNSIIENAQGDYIAFFDDDDMSRSDRLSEQLVRIQAYGRLHRTDFIFCYTNRNILLVGETIPSGKAFAIGRTFPEPHGLDVADFLLWHSGASGFVWGMFGSCTLMAPRSAFLKVGPFDPDFRRCAEWDLAVRAAFMGAHFISVDQPLVCQRKTPTRDKAGKIPLKYAMMLRKKHKNYLDAKGVYAASLMIARARYFGGKHRMVWSRFYHFLACCLAPRTIGYETACRVLRRVTRLQVLKKFYG